MTQLNRVHRERARVVLHDFGDGWVAYYYPYGEGYDPSPCALIEDPLGVSRDQSDAVCDADCAMIWLESGARDWEQMYEDFQQHAREQYEEDLAIRLHEERAYGA